jgi:hypothetical protein
MQVIISNNKLNKNIINKQNMNKKEERRIWKIVKKLKKKGLLISQTNEDIKNEPTALSNSEYRLNTNKKDE